MKRIAIQNNLEELRNELAGRGYEIIDFNDKGHVDAVVYTDDYSGIKSINNEAGVNPLGAVLINARGKTIEQVIYVIESRRYEGLFT
jgi:hypothetical protein